jgi:hypothetical protein
VEAEGFQIVVAAILPTTRRIKVHSRLMSALFELAFGDNVRCQLGILAPRLGNAKELSNSLPECAVKQ